MDFFVSVLGQKLKILNNPLIHCTFSLSCQQPWNRNNKTEHIMAFVCATWRSCKGRTDRYGGSDILPSELALLVSNVAHVVVPWAVLILEHLHKQVMCIPATSKSEHKFERKICTTETNFVRLLYSLMHLNQLETQKKELTWALEMFASAMERLYTQ
jgi:hypothetical protein